MIKVIGSNLTIPEGKINLDCEFSKSIGFTTEAGFDKDCYMWGFPDSWCPDRPGTWDSEQMD